MAYAQEFRDHWRALTAATVGMAMGLALAHYVMSLFAPPLIAEFGWSKSQYALIGATPFFTLPLVPLIGRMVDHFGPRASVAVGFISLPISYLLLSLMTGSFALFFAISVVKAVLGIMTTTMVFARVVVERFETARGLSLSIIMSAPSLMGMAATPFIAYIIDEHGWRSAFQFLALITPIGGMLCWALLGQQKQAHTTKRKKAISWSDAKILLRSPILLLALGGMFLVNLPQALTSSQLSLMLLDSGANSALVPLCVAIYAGGVSVGRILSGLALDRFAVHHVAICTLALPAVGLIAIASPYDAPFVLLGSIMLMALAQGAEGDIGAYLIAQHFGIANYSLLMSLMTVALTIGSATGALLLSGTLKISGSYNSALYISALATVVGALLFFATGRTMKGEKAIA